MDFLNEIKRNFRNLLHLFKLNYYKIIKLLIIDKLCNFIFELMLIKMNEVNGKFQYSITENFFIVKPVFKNYFMFKRDLKNGET
jgi:hypothetical protein